jgi:hypothetical protein
MQIVFRNNSIEILRALVIRLLLIVFCGFGICGGLGAIDIAVEGKAKAVIVVPKNAPIPVQFAAMELKHYLGEMTGSEFSIVDKLPENQPAIVLGSELAKARGIDIASLKRDGYVIQGLGERLYVAGTDDTGKKSRILLHLYDSTFPDERTAQGRAELIGEPTWDFERATLYGVYDLLEHLGVLWALPGPKGEIVPHKPTLRLENLNLRQEPHFELRAISRPIWPSTRYVNRGVIDPKEYKSLGLSLHNQMLWFLRQRRSSKWMAFNHRPARHQWAHRFADDHPEYFALQKNGKRLTGGRGGERAAYLSYTSQGVYQETLADIDAFFGNKPASSRGIAHDPKFNNNNGWHPLASYGDTFSLLPNDGLQVDYSKQSVAYLHENAAFGDRHSDYVWQFVDKVARATEKKWPAKKLTCLAYQTYWEVPQSVKKLPKNVTVGIAALSGPSRLANSVEEKTYHYFMNLIALWHAMNNQPMLFWNYGLYRYKHPKRVGVPMLLPRHIARLTHDISRYGRYLHMQVDQDNLVMEHLNVWVQYKLAWNPNLDIEVLLSKYFTMAYGPGAKTMKEMLDNIEQRSMVIAATNADAAAIWEKHFTEVVMADYRRLMDKALSLTAGTPYETFARLMDKRFLGEMEKARSRYVVNGKNLYTSSVNVRNQVIG